MPRLLSGSGLRERLAELTRTSDSIDVAVAWAATTWPGMQGILDVAIKRRTEVRLLVGVGGYLTNPNHLSEIANSATLRIYGKPTGQLFHPKLYLFESSGVYTCWVGSANLTHNGFHENVEAVAEFEDLDGSVRRRFQDLWISDAAKDLKDFDLASYASERKRLLAQVPGALSDSLQLDLPNQSSPDEVDVLKAEWNSYFNKLLNVKPDVGKELDLNDWLRVLDRRSEFLGRNWEDDFSKFDLDIMYGKKPFQPFGRLNAIAQGRFQGVAGKRKRLDIGGVLTEVGGWKMFQEPLAQKALKKLLQIDGCGPALATRLLVLARPDWFVVVSKKSFQGLAARFEPKLSQRLTPELYGRLLAKIHEQPWCKSLQPEDAQERGLWNYRTALIDPLVYTETGDSPTVYDD